MWLYLFAHYNTFLLIYVSKIYGNHEEEEKVGDIGRCFWENKITQRIKDDTSNKDNQR